MVRPGKERMKEPPRAARPAPQPQPEPRSAAQTRPASGGAPGPHTSLRTAQGLTTTATLPGTVHELPTRPSGEPMAALRGPNEVSRPSDPALIPFSRRSQANPETTVPRVPAAGQPRSCRKRRQERHEHVEAESSAQAQKRLRVTSPATIPTSSQTAVADYRSSNRQLPPDSNDQQRASARPRNDGYLNRRADPDAAYLHPNYPKLLAAKGSFMTDWISTASDRPAASGPLNGAICQRAFDYSHGRPTMKPETFERTCQNLLDRNRAKIARDIGQIIVPPAEALKIRRVKRHSGLTECVDETWDNCVPFFGDHPRPHPDYTVGYARSAFSDEVHQKLESHAMPDGTSHFMATKSMWFPFFVSGVAETEEQLELVDRKNANAMTLAVRAVVDLYRMAYRHRELHREVVAFSLSHNQSHARVYGHYPVFDKESGDFTYHRRLLEDVHFARPGSSPEQKWRAYNIVRGIYFQWAPYHFNHLRDMLDVIMDKRDEERFGNPWLPEEETYTDAQVMNEGVNPDTWDASEPDADSIYACESDTDEVYPPIPGFGQNGAGHQSAASTRWQMQASQALPAATSSAKPVWEEYLLVMYPNRPGHGSAPARPHNSDEPSL